MERRHVEAFSRSRRQFAFCIRIYDRWRVGCRPSDGAGDYLDLLLISGATVLPGERRYLARHRPRLIKSIEESQKEIEDRLEQFRKHRGEA